MAKHPGGRPSLYKPEYCKQLIEYFSATAVSHDDRGNVIAGTFPTLARFSANIGVHRETLIEWCDKYPEFSDAYKKAKALQEANLVEGTLAGAYQSTFAIFTAKNVIGWRDKTETEHTGKDGGPIEHSLTVTFRKPHG
jgi:hypothetical protein